ncbi:MAG: DUF2723 domain-containing protein [Bacteroidales bacterium]|nr:DUF2723 domain-containing protein [Bacteroidales bacterium]
MFDLRFKRINRIAGWSLFLLSFIVYLLTIEPTVSFWDCGEFILSAWKLQVGHPPGASLFLIVGRVFSLFAFGDTSKVALMINILSALASAFTIMFLYWTIVHLLGKIVIKDGDETSFTGLLAILAAGIIGSLAYAFSDTFWFSAVEGEVYATSSLFTALVFWAILKWENEAEDANGGRWLVLIAYLMGLSIGVHLLNLLALPAIVLVYYFRNYSVSTKGILKALLLSALMLFFLVFILLPYTVKIAGWFELFFVNTLGLPYNTGLIIYLLALCFSLVWAISLSIKMKSRILNYVFTLLSVVIIGYSSIAMVMIRANAKPPMNQNDPSDLFSMIYYVNREQYGSTPLLNGNYYSAPVIDVKKRTGGYTKIDGKYEPYSRNEYKYDKRFKTIFPRMYSNTPGHIREYEYWANIQGNKVSIRSGSGNREVTLPSFGENLRFFFRYQMGYMYWRYFMWNFSGRQNDIQGNGNVLHGNWISGFGPLDNLRLGTNDSMPDSLRNNPGRNAYFMLPLLFGVAGMIWQYRRRRNSFWVVLTLFIMTGLAIVVYLNQYPLQPRERDYAYAGSFYAFTIWIGMGFYLVYELLSKVLNKNIALGSSFIISLAAIPLLMLTQNWDDHNRSGRYTARDIGSNYLNSCDENAILFTYGDNDSFPVWYAQDVEGVRTDVRVANLSYLNAAWYLDMMRRKAYDSEPVPLSLSSEKYRPGSREQLPIVEQIKRPVDISEVLNFVALDEKGAKIDFTGKGDFHNYIPVKSFIVPVDTVVLLKNNPISAAMRERLVDKIIWTFPKEELYKNDLAIMDIISTNQWTRPLYFASTVPQDNYKGLDKYFQMEGLSYRIMPIDSSGAQLAEYGEVNTEKMYQNLMTKFKWGNASDPDVYLDEINRRMLRNFRRMFGILASELAISGDTERAGEVIARCEEVIPVSKLPYSYYSIDLLNAYFLCGQPKKGEEMAMRMTVNSMDIMEYLVSLDYIHRYGLEVVIAMNLEVLRASYAIAARYNIAPVIERVEQNMDRYYNELYGRPGVR